MIHSITGKLMVKGMDMAVVECSGVGFKCFTSLTTLGRLPAIGDTVTLYTYLNVREDALDLYGFSGQDELACFRLLLSVSGVGPKAALGLLSTMSPEKFALCVASSDIKFITTAPGIGRKTAERIVLELKDKVSSQEIAGGFSPAASPLPAAGAGNLGEAVSALLVLGYSQSEAAQALKGCGEEESVEDLIRQALKKLAKQK